MIELRDVSKTFPEHYGALHWIRRRGKVPRRPAIDGVSLSVESGELFGLLGANGSGKSTILRMIAGLVAPDAGRITVAGVDVAVQPLRARAYLGLSTGDERSFILRLTARQNLELYAGMCGVPPSRRAASIARATNALDLHADLDRRFDAFSSGMRQRLGIARAMLNDPDVLLLDEPTRAVDPVHAEQLRAAIVDLVRRRGKTVVLATNLLDEAWICDRVVVLRAGSAIALGSVDDVRERAAGQRRYAIELDRVDDALLARLRAVDGVTGIERVSSPAGAPPRLHAALDARVRSLSELLGAMSANGVAVTSIGPLEVAATELFENLAYGANGAR